MYLMAEMAEICRTRKLLKIKLSTITLKEEEIIKVSTIVLKKKR
jgi:deoxyribose-phosphate aldolase